MASTMPNLPSAVRRFINRFAAATGCPVQACEGALRDITTPEYADLQNIAVSQPDQAFAAAVALYYGLPVASRMLLGCEAGLTAFAAQLRG
jgi:hypothetical protein